MPPAGLPGRARQFLPDVALLAPRNGLARGERNRAGVRHADLFHDAARPLVHHHGGGNDLPVAGCGEAPGDEGGSAFAGEALAPEGPREAIAKFGQPVILRPEAEPADKGFAGSKARRPHMRLGPARHQEGRIGIGCFPVDRMSAVEIAHHRGIALECPEIGCVRRHGGTEHQARCLQQGQGGKPHHRSVGAMSCRWPPLLAQARRALK